jgi:hypothetical protein
VGTPYFLSKPFRLDALLRLLDQALRERMHPTQTPTPITMYP